MFQHLRITEHAFKVLLFRPLPPHVVFAVCVCSVTSLWPDLTEQVVSVGREKAL